MSTSELIERLANTLSIYLECGSERAAMVATIIVAELQDAGIFETNP